jgi:mono/diheme cytochrome c family protein
MEPLPADHDGRGDDTCLACHDVQPAPTVPLAGSKSEQGQALWQERPGLACRNCHGLDGEGGYGPDLAGSSLDLETFIARTRMPLSERMPPIGASLDDPAFETSGIWISDEELRLVYEWLSTSR